MSRSTLLAASFCALLGLCAVFALLHAVPVVAGTALRLDLQGLVDRADLVLEGRVQSVECARDARGRIETRYTLGVARTFLGEVNATRVVRVPGGVLPNGEGLVLPGLPRLAQGEEALLFLSAESRAGLRVPVGLAQGRFRVERAANGARSLVRDVTDLALVDEHGRVLPEGARSETFDYAATVARVEAAVAQRAERERAARGGAK